MSHTLKSLGSFSACFEMASSLSSTELSTSMWVFLLKLQTTVWLMDLFGPIRGPACFSHTSSQKVIIGISKPRFYLILHHTELFWCIKWYVAYDALAHAKASHSTQKYCQCKFKATNRGKLLCFVPQVVALIISLLGHFSSYILLVLKYQLLWSCYQATFAFPQCNMVLLSGKVRHSSSFIVWQRYWPDVRFDKCHSVSC